MKFEKDMSMNELKTIGLVIIKDKENAQQAVFNIDYLAQVLKALQALQTADFKEIVVTLEDDCPIIFGSRESGIGIAPIVR